MQERKNQRKPRCIGLCVLCKRERISGGLDVSGCVFVCKRERISGGRDVSGCVFVCKRERISGSLDVSGCVFVCKRKNQQEPRCIGLCVLCKRERISGGLDVSGCVFYVIEKESAGAEIVTNETDRNNYEILYEPYFATILAVFEWSKVHPQKK